MDCKNRKSFDDSLKSAFNIDEFGTNYAEFKGKPNEAIDHLINVKDGQVIGAMSKDGMGDIDFVWGKVTDAKKKLGYGLSHIIDKHGVDLAKKLPKIIDESIVVINNGRRAILETKDHRAVIGLQFDEADKVWLVSGYEMSETAKAKSPALAKLKEDMNSLSSTASNKTIISKAKNKVNQVKQDFKEANSKRDFAVDTVWNTVFAGLEASAKPLKMMFDAMGVKKKVTEANFFEVTPLQQEASEVVNNFRNLKAHIYDEAGAIMKGLDTLSKDDNVALIKALNGDMEARELKNTLVPFYEKFRAVIDKNAQDLVDAGILESKDKIEHYLKRYYKDYIDNDAITGGSVAYAKLKKRKDLTYDERIALGMVEDATFVIANTIAEQNVLLQKAKVLKALADKFGVDEEIDGYVLISDESATKGSGLKRFGALAGKYVPREVKAELDYSRIVSSEINALNDVIYPMIDHLKVNLTVKNPSTHIYNIASNVLLSGINGDMLAVGKVLYMRYKTPNKFKALLKKANKYGLNSYLDDFEQAHIELAPDGKKVNVVASIWKNLYMTQDSKLGKGVRKLYDWEDKIFKLGAFAKNLEQGMDEATAYKQAVDVYVDYSTPLPAGIRFVDKSGLMPFLHYQYKATPAVAKTMAKHPIRTMIMGTGVFMIGGSVFQNEDEDLYKPGWAEDKLNLLGVKEWIRLGNGWYINAGRMIPGTKFEFELGGIVKGTLGIINGESPLGYDIGSDNNSDMENYGLRTLAMAENYLPSMTLGRYAQRLTHIGLGKAGMVEPKKNYYKEDMTVQETMLRAGGVRKFNEKKELNSKLKKAKSLKKRQNKQKGADKKANEDDYNAKARRVKKAGKKAGFNLTAKKGVGADAFDLKVPKFGF